MLTDSGGASSAALKKFICPIYRKLCTLLQKLLKPLKIIIGSHSARLKKKTAIFTGLLGAARNVFLTREILCVKKLNFDNISR